MQNLQRYFFKSSILAAANQEAISDALQKLTERQAARQYRASAQLTALSKHLSNLNLANMGNGQQHRLGKLNGLCTFYFQNSTLFDDCFFVFVVNKYVTK